MLECKTSEFPRGLLKVHYTTFSDCLFDTSDVRLGEIWDEERANGQIHLSLPISHMSLYRIESFRIPQSKYTERFGV